MWNLEYELIAVLLLAAIIGLIMGRFLCKSGESEEKVKKEKALYAYNAVKNDMQEQYQTIEVQQESIKEKELLISQLEQKSSNLTTRLNSSDSQREELLGELKVLDKYKNRFESLTKEFEVQTDLVEKLKAQKAKNLEEIEQFKVLTNTLKTNIKTIGDEKTKGLIKQDAQEKSLTQLKERNKEQVKNIQELDAWQKEQSINFKEAQNKELQLNKKIEEQELQRKELEERINEKTKECEALEVSYSTYKESFNHEKLIDLEKVTEKLSLDLETMHIEREDLVSRLRAISSVVGAVGVEEE